jgi:hypothetical protein
LVEYLGPALPFSVGRSGLLQRVASDQRYGHRGLRIDHLLVGGVYLTPGARFLKCRTRQSTVARIGDSDLDGVLVHWSIDTEDLRRYHDVLREVLRDAAADHQ